MLSRISRSVSRFVVLACVVAIPLALAAQDAAKPAAKKTTSGDTGSKWDIFVGYSFLSPHGTVTTPLYGGSTGGGGGTILSGIRSNATAFGTTTTVTSSYQNVDLGEIFSVSRFFNKYVGVQAELGLHEWGIQNTNAPGLPGTQGNNDGFTSIVGGLVLRNPTGKFTPFAHVAGGAGLVDGPAHNPYTWGPSVTLGGGLDYELNPHWALRLFQGDYEFFHPNFGPLYGGAVNINAVRLSAGVVYHVGSQTPPPPVTLSCSASPTAVFPGDPVTVTASAGGLNPKENVIYSLTGPGLSATATTATVATASLAPGSYNVKCGVKEGKPGKEGLKPWETADATASFTVKAFEPPTVSCSASPSTIKPGETSTVTATGVSPQNRPLTYSYSATSGAVNGTGASATFDSTGAPTGATGITCSTTDDKGQTATANTTVTITAPYVPPVPHTQALCSISFATDKARPTRVNNEAKACLDEVALNLQKQSDAKVVVVGTSDTKEKAKTAKEAKLAVHNKHVLVEDSAAQRAVNTKAYLVTEKGIDAARVSVATSATDGQTVEDFLVPAGANFSSDVAGTTPVNESAVKVQVRKPLGARPVHRKPVARKAAK